MSRLIIYVTEKKIKFYKLTNKEIDLININGEESFRYDQILDIERFINGALNSILKSNFSEYIIYIIYNNVNLEIIAELVKGIKIVKDLQVLSLNILLEVNANKFFESLNKKSVVVKFLEDNYSIDGYSSDTIKICKTDIKSEICLNIYELIHFNSKIEVANTNKIDSKEEINEKVIKDLYKYKNDCKNIKKIRSSICKLLGISNYVGSDFQILKRYVIALVLKKSNIDMFSESKKNIIEFGKKYFYNEEFLKILIKNEEYMRNKVNKNNFEKEIFLLLNSIYIDEIHKEDVLLRMKDNILKNNYNDLIQKYI